MKRQVLLTLTLALVASGTCYLTHSALSQVITNSVGKPSCEPFKDYSGNNCYRLKCDPSPDSYTNYDSCDGAPLAPGLYGVSLCEHGYEGAVIQNPIKCSTSPVNSISYSWRDDGGNGDGIIDARDAIFASLRLWQDANHNGVSEAGELRTLAALDVARFHLDYKESKRTDEHGNRFRYRAKLDDAKKAKAGRWAWDVFPVKPL